MKYEPELNFMQKILKNSHVPYFLSTNPPEYLASTDYGISHLLIPHSDLLTELKKIFNMCGPNKIYRFSDQFMCHYLILKIPDEENPLYFVIGPYITSRFTKREIRSRIDKFAFPPEIVSQLEDFLLSLPILSSESSLLTLANTLGECIWGGLNNFSVQDIGHTVFSDLEPVAERPDYMEPMDAFLSMRLLEKRYSDENRLIQAVSQGQTHKAEMLISHFSAVHIDRRAPDMIRNLKNYLIVVNVLMRKAAEYGAVHPLHIDSLSSRLARQIEQTNGEEALFRLANEIVRKYCLLVRNHSMKGHSLLVRKILVRIDSDLTADLSLKAQADFLDVNPSYLSTLFKKETGTTLTEYVNRKRVEHGIFLLNTTQMQIQTVAQNCGISDVNYFTKTFKKIVGKTPKDYRNHISPYMREYESGPHLKRRSEM